MRQEIEALLTDMRFKVVRTEAVTDFESKAEYISVTWMNGKYNVGVELRLWENKAYVGRCEMLPGGQVRFTGLCPPMRLFWSRPEILKAFLEEVISPAKAAASMKAVSLPEA